MLLELYFKLYLAVDMTFVVNVALSLVVVALLS